MLEEKQVQLQNLFDAYISECEYTKQLRPYTVIGYKDAFNNFLGLMPEVRKVDDLHQHILSVFFQRLSKRERKVGKDIVKVGVKASTIRAYYNRLIIFFRWLETRGLIEKNSLTSNIVKPPMPKYTDSRALSDEEVSQIIAAITLNTIEDSFAYLRDLTMVSLFLYTGIRKSELLALKIQDVDFKERTLFVDGKTSKSKISRVIPLNAILFAQLKVYLQERRSQRSKCDALIVTVKHDTQLSQHGLKHWVDRYVKLSGVKFHVHRFRHTFACSLAKSNADIITIMKVMGHSSLEMTMRYLRSIKPENARSYIDKIRF